MTLPGSESGGSPRRRSAWVLGVVGVLVVVAIGVVIADRVAAARERDEDDALEPTAWENRVQMEPVLVETARQLGITSEPLPESDAPLGCERRDGRQGLSYDLPELEGAALDDPESALTDVARAWEELGYAVSSVGGGAGDVWRVNAETPEGAIVEVLTGPAATIVSGETGCFLEDGAPDEA
ncbi:hypothetical protein AFE02nite_32230 [Actinotalea fermentans]|uniref:Uncharacterized protein n=1 Tax=Actinotalea fermentans TaxID=43671 RepID=A0A511Z202_9CELL|nr:hypothetical protein AFE02nite_32230 [Actinotalea fermentans]